MKNLFRIVMCLSFFMALFSYKGYSQLTTSAIRGQVTTTTNETLPGASVVMVHEPTGSQYGTTTNESGTYNLANLNPGGPYTLTVSFVGYNKYEKKEIFLTLGQTLQINATISENTSELEEVLVIANTSGVFDGNTTGSKTTVSAERIEAMPTVTRGISDIARLTPQAKINADGGIEIAGQNSRYNSFTIDGAVQNDVFGLASNGTNGGQIGVNPMSMDIIDQLTISLSPYDVTQSGFAGAGINAVTKSGTNQFKGSVFDYFRNEKLAGKTPTDNPYIERERLDKFTSNTTGFTLGGPIIKNKVFFFVSGELQRDKTPKPYDFADYGGTATRAEVDALKTKLINDYGYDPGTYEKTEESLDAEKVFAKIDWNISRNHKLSVRHQYSNGKSLSPSTSSSSRIYFSNSGIDFTSKTNATTAELKSLFSNKFANKLMIGYTNVDDNRDPMGDPFPYLYLRSEAIYLGSEQYSTANRLKQKVWTFTDDFNIYSGNHNFTLGMHHEYYDMFNVFIRQNYGSYSYDDLATFMNNGNAYQYDRSFSNVDNIAGDNTAAAAAFKFLQLGFYAQDSYQVTDKLNLTYGIRVDIPIFTEDPMENTDFNNNVIPYLENTYRADFAGAKTGQMPDAKPLFSPRVGFNYDINGDKTLQLRGGVGLFTSRIPFVWPGGSYNNNGMMIGGMRLRSSSGDVIPFNGDWQDQPSVTGAPSGQIDLFAKDFKMPQVLRTNLALDKKFENGIIATVDVTYTKNVNNVIYDNLLVQETGNSLTGTGDNRAIWEDVSGDVNSNSGATGSYTGIYLGDNTSKGHSFNIMAQAEKDFANGLYTSIAYNYGVAKSLNDGQSSQNSSQWRVPNTYGRNDLTLGYSAYDLGHRIMANVSYKWEYSQFANTTFTIFYNGQSGSRFSYGYDNGSTDGPIGDNVDGRDMTLVYVPENQNDIILVDDEDYGTAAEQWASLNSFIEGNDYLSDRRGKFVEKNGDRMPFEHTIDLKIMQEFKFKVSPTRENKIQVGLDIFNFTNMLNKKWGRTYYSIGDYGNYPLLEFAGYQNGTTPTYIYTNTRGEDTWGIDDAGLQSSRWQAQLTLRYIF
ncbi:TonB-dependent receptor [Mangrovibacterium lignilyticum]|uniref:TonB-dependent receptor n=1 Tax=Mangrovibacterium lignilyticum TaxID=2668052 RepID=UPI0013D60C40|nr:carboxypeptidase regulatory-like domain-containing protein [Mangrovibacterium lignilyticum]